MSTVPAVQKPFGIGVDIGGTFTDTIVIGPESRVTIGKAPSTPPDFEGGFVDSVASAAERMGLSLEDLLSQAHGVFHGTTVGTNALVERTRTAKVGLLATRGTRDVTFTMQAGGRNWGATPEYIARTPAHVKPTPLVPKDLVEEIDERVAFDGAELVALNESRARESIERLIDKGVEAFAISLLWSVVNPDHEEQLAALVREMAPEAFVSISSRVIARSGEYERTIATIVNSLIGPVMRGYLANLEGELCKRGYGNSLFVMSCAGGVIESSYAQELPILTIGSGPVAGVIGAGSLTRASSRDNGKVHDVLTADMGGTTLDVGVIRNGEPLTRGTTRHDQYEYFLPTLDVRSVGAGGGSIVTFDSASNSLRVGPRSAGARPGPAAYKRGGTEATVTDADLVLGFLNPDYFLGGTLPLSVDAASTALSKVGEPLGFDASETAAAAARIVDSQMADAIRLASVQQGYDPRDHLMYAYGGAGPVHASALATELGIRRVVVPLSELAAGWSAFGTVSADALVVEEAPAAMAAPLNHETLNDAFEQLEERVYAALDRQGIERESVTLEHMVDMRYTAQINTVRVGLETGSFDADSVDGIVDAFDAEYARLFGRDSGFAEAGYVLTAVSVRGRAERGGASLEARSTPAGGDPADASDCLKGERPVRFYETGPEPVTAPIYDGPAITADMSIEGPAILEFVDTTVVVRDGQRASLDAAGSIVIDL